MNVVPKQSKGFNFSALSITGTVIIAVGFIIIIILASTIYYVPPGHVGVLIYKIPPAGNTKGIADVSLNPGYGMRNFITQDVIVYPVYMQTIVLCKGQVEGSHQNDEINVNSTEGQPISCDVSLAFELNPQKVPELYVAFRQPIENITHGFVKQTVRQAMQEVVGTTRIEDFIGKEKASVVMRIQKVIQDRLNEYGFVVKQFTINEIRAPKTIMEAIEQKNAAVQEALKAQNELQRKKFEAQQKVLEAEGEASAILTKSRAQAEANKLISQSITPALIKYESIKKWNGVLPQVSGGATPFIDMRDLTVAGGEGK
ncbi:MAG: prohibitin family protein [Candidatus Eremiobacterota bacterium]